MQQKGWITVQFCSHPHNIARLVFGTLGVRIDRRYVTLSRNAAIMLHCLAPWDDKYCYVTMSRVTWLPYANWQSVSTSHDKFNHGIVLLASAIGNIARPAFIQPSGLKITQTQGIIFCHAIISSAQIRHHVLGWTFDSCIVILQCHTILTRTISPSDVSPQLPYATWDVRLRFHALLQTCHVIMTHHATIL